MPVKIIFLKLLEYRLEQVVEELFRNGHHRHLLVFIIGLYRTVCVLWTVGRAVVNLTFARGLDDFYSH